MVERKPMEIGFIYTESMTNPVRAEEVFREMRDMGATAVMFHAYEQDLHRWPKDVPRVHEAASRVGLRRYISPARLGGMMAGLYAMPDVYTSLHPESMVTHPIPRGPHYTLGLSGRIACVNNPGFRAYALDYLDGLLRRLGADGMLIDEPQGLIHNVRCECQYCQAATRPGESAKEAQHRFHVDFLSALCAKAREREPQIRTTLMAALGNEDRARFELIACVRDLESIAVEPYWLLVEKDLDWLRDACRIAVERVRGLDRELDIWALNFGITSPHESEIPEALRIIAASQPDAIWMFWWWRGNDDPAAVMRATREGLARLRR